LTTTPRPRPRLHTVRRPPASPLSPYTTLFRPHRPGLRGHLAAPRPGRGSAGRRRQGRAHRQPGPVRPRIVGPDEHLSRGGRTLRSEEHTSELQSRENLVCRLLLEKKKAEFLQI